MATGRLLLAGIVWVVLAGAGFAAEPGRPVNSCEAGKLPELADQVVSDTKDSIKKAHYPEEVSQIIGQAQMDFLRILIRQNDELIRQNNEILQHLRKENR
ncbi:MAG: hypothetical protein A4E72_02277 [Syntrophus sp. PtaU1.Bin208]|nr:MAG: hypothetical protein A4E72_02277 [Syntrophus sp. PtaU1.Bin208]